MGLTDEQRRRIEENRMRALARMAERQAAAPPLPPLQQQPSRPPAAPQVTPRAGFPPPSRMQVDGSGGRGVHPVRHLASVDSAATAAAPVTSACRTAIAAPPRPSAVQRPLVLQPRLDRQLLPGSAGNGCLVSSANGAIGPQQQQQSRAAAGSGQPAPQQLPPQVRGHCLLTSTSRFEVVVSYHKELVEMMKNIEGRSYETATRRWNFPLSSHDNLLKAVQRLQPAVHIEPLPAYVLRALADYCKSPLESSDPASSVRENDVDLSTIDSRLTDALMPFQREGIRFGLQHDGRVLIADDMGLGKTIQAIGIAAYYRSEWPMLAVVPSSVRFAWKEQFLQWLPSLAEYDINVISSGRDDIASGSRVTVVSYDIMVRLKAAFLERRYRVLVLDESHLLKSYKTARTKAALALCRVARRVVLLSGTPALSRPAELYTQLSAVNEDIFGSAGGMHAFGLRYCEAKQLPWGWDYSGACNLSELEILLKACVMIRRTKAEVLSQLPAKTRQVITLDPQLVCSDDRALRLGEKRLEQTIKKGSADQRSALLTYFHDSGAAKVRAVVEYVVDLLECDRKFLVFAHHQEVLDALENAVASQRCEYIRIDGRTPSRDRAVACDRFQSDSRVRVALLSIMAANAGINLTSASLVVFAELFWNPGILAQAEDRVHRIGQKDCVSVQYLVAKHTADDYLWPIIVRKLRTLSEAGLTKDNFSTDTLHIKESDREHAIASLLLQQQADAELDGDEERGGGVGNGGGGGGGVLSSIKHEMAPGPSRPQNGGLFKFFAATSRHPSCSAADDDPVAGEGTAPPVDKKPKL